MKQWIWWLRYGLWFIGLWLIGCSGQGPGVETSTQAQPLQNQSAEEGAPSVGTSKPRPTRVLPSGQRVVWVQMTESANLTSAKTVKNWKARGNAVYSALTGTAKRSQAALTAELAAKHIRYTPHWIANVIRIEADDATIQTIAKRSDVARIVEDHTWFVPPLEPAAQQQKVAAVEWNIENIRASEAWADFGARGEGVVVASIDTGTQWDHPALVSQYRGTQSDGTVDHNYNWFDPSNVCGYPSEAPCDNVGHGTHTMGTIVGDDGGENQIGVAPGAKWITAKGCEDSWCSTEALVSSGEWMLAPTDLNGENPRTDLRPQIVSNSWGGYSGDDFYRDVVQAWVAAQIFPVFAAGNDGDYCGSASSPGDYPESYAVGAYDINEELAYFSGRGPSAYGVIKPNVAAPGVDVRSSVPDGSYDVYSGTSMATPHVAGAVALLWSAAVAISGDIDATREILDMSAVNHEDVSCGGDADNNNAWGQGQLDVYAALTNAPIGPTGTLVGSVTDSDGAPIAGARVSATDDITRATSTDETGAYSLRLPVGGYDVNAAAFGFIAQNGSVTIEEDVVTNLDFTLEQAPSHAVAGTVVDSEGAAIAGAEVTLLGTPLPVQTTDESGYFEFSLVPEGEYVLHASRTGCYLDADVAVVVDGEQSVVVPLDSKVDAWGYQCRPVAFEYIEGDTQLGIGGDDEQTSVSLPFAFSLYGQAYESLFVTTNGFAAFISDYAAYWNESIPNSYPPNAAMYALWDDLYVTSGGVYTATLGEAPNRQFVVEWRDVAFLGDESQTASFELVLGENGNIVMQYASADSPLAQGSAATIGIENAAGDVALQYSYNEASVESGTAVLYEVPFSGFVQGTVTDANDGAPISGATVTATGADGEIRVGRTSASGGYLLQLTQGAYTLEIARSNYVSISTNVDVVEDETIVLDFALQTGLAALTPATLQLTLPVDAVRTRTFVLRNDGSTEMQFEVKEAGGARRPAGVSMIGKPDPIADPSARTTKDFASVSPMASAVAPSTPGDIISSFTPVGLQLAWGIGEATNLWLSDAITVENNEFGLDGTPTGVSFPASWSGEWPADMAFDEARGLVCQLAVGGDNAIHCWNPVTGEVEITVSGSPWTSISQRGLAYREADDVFFVGGWNEGIIYQVKGSSYEDAGSVISSCTPPDWAISGLAHNSAANVLWMATNSETDTIYELNPDDCTLLATMAPPQSGSYQGAGLDLDTEGNLWVVAQSPNRVYLMESGVPEFGDIPWLVAEPVSGIVGVGEERSIQVTVDTTDLEPGLYLGTLIVKTTAARQPSIRVPVSLVVSGFLHGINCGGQAYVDTLEDTWEADRAYSSGGYGYVQRGTVRSAWRAISGTDDDRLYQSQRENAYAYRFDNVPNGTYQVDVNFAELQNVRYGQRLFDVIVEDELLLPAHDIFYEVGTFAADPNRFQVEVTDGRLDVRLVSRTRKAPVVNAIRVVHRPDL